MASQTVMVTVWATTLFIIARVAGFAASKKARSPMIADWLISGALFLTLTFSLPFYLGIIN